MSANNWDLQECHLLCLPYKEYLFSIQFEEKIRIKFLEREKELLKLGKRVNKKAVDLYNKVKTEYNALEFKKSVVMLEKEKIELFIKDLDTIKKKVIKNAWIKVNKDFGSIFTTLLPGTSARLCEPKGQTYLEGLEVHVAFGRVWKQSLIELSGGQRSLLALSLILALLLLNPAPIYILDEIDAALDLNHSQNIGKMIHKHFPLCSLLLCRSKRKCLKMLM